MKRVSLDEADKARLSELVSKYVITQGIFHVKSDGEVTNNKNGPLIRLFSLKESLTIDFLSVTQTVITKIMEEKGGNPFVASLCGEALGVLVELNDRQEVIKKLYIAHLLSTDTFAKMVNATLNRGGGDNNHQKQQKQPRMQTIEIEHVRTHPQGDLSRQVAEICNDARESGGIVLVRQ